MEAIISVIIPCYNVENYIEKCLNSILNQNTDIPYEVIVINDGSKDSTCQKIKLFDNSRIRIVDIENHGAAYCRNYGAKIANGKYLIFLDSDDYVSETYISTLYKNIEDGYIPFGAISKIVNNKKEIFKELDAGKYSLEIIVEKALCGQIMMTYNRTIFLKEKFLEIENNNLRYCEDTVFLLEYLIKNNVGIKFIEEEIYYYNMDNINSATNNFYSEKYVGSFIRIPFAINRIFGKYKVKGKQFLVNREFVRSAIRVFRTVNYKSFKKIFNNSRYDVIRENKLISCKNFKYTMYMFFLKYRLYCVIFFLESIVCKKKNRRKKIFLSVENITINE